MQQHTQQQGRQGMLVFRSQVFYERAVLKRSVWTEACHPVPPPPVRTKQVTNQAGSC